jgi:glycosyltransferase involved in cell wall biosynthesis
VRWFRRLILRRANAVTVISTYLEDIVRRESETRTYTVPNGVSPERFINRPDVAVMKQAHEHMATGPHHRVIMSVSRLVPKNGLANLIRALAIVRNEIVHDEPVLVLIGAGELEGELKHLSLLEGVSDSVRFLGHVPHGQLPAYLHAAHVFARPSLSEGMGSAFLEAMATGTPVVASNVGGIADFLEDGKTGYVCDPNNPESIARALIRAMRNDENVKAVVAAAREMVRIKYDWNTIARQMEEVYKDVAV